MVQQLHQAPPFVVDLLTTLRNERFSPLAWVRFLGRSQEMARRTAHEHLSLKRSWQRVAWLLGIVAFALLIGSFVLEGPAIVPRLLPGFLFCVVWQISDLYWHLGLIRRGQREKRGRTGELYPVVGLANVLTQLRGLAASFLLGRLAGGVATPTGLASLLFFAGVVTDILDGYIARRTRTQSVLGQLSDAEADFCLYLAITIILIHNNILPLWLGLVMMARFLIPLLAALISYFFFIHRLSFSSTLWGKLAGVAQCLYFLVLLAPTQLAAITRILNLPLLLITLVLLIIAPAAQIASKVKPG